MADLSLRLSVIATLVPNGARVCDIGTDHGYLPIYLKSTGRAKTVIAADIGEKPLANARKNIEKSGVSGIDLRLCDGLTGINKGEVDTIIVAGMGGEVISHILEDCSWLSESPSTKLILQPTTSAEELRRWLVKNQFEITAEEPLCENGKVYSIMSAIFGGKAYSVTDSFYYTGKVSPHSKDGITYIEKQYNRLKSCADSIKDIPEKSKDYKYYKTVSDNIYTILNSSLED